MELTVEQIKKLVRKYPYLRPTSIWTGLPIEDWDYTYINGVGDLPKGWERLFLLFCKNIRPELEKFNYVNKFSFSQIKEKYGTMRLYNNGYPKDSRINEFDCIYEYLSVYICEYCGKPSKYETPGWVTELCESCYKENYLSIYTENPDSYKIKRKNFIVTIKGWSDGKPYTKKYNSKPYWEEYLKTRKMNDKEFISYILGDEEIEEEHGY